MKSFKAKHLPMYHSTGASFAKHGPDYAESPRILCSCVADGVATWPSSSFRFKIATVNWRLRAAPSINGGSHSTMRYLLGLLFTFITTQSPDALPPLGII